MRLSIVCSILHKVLFCDSDNITTQIYSKVYCGYVNEEIKKYEMPYDLFLFLDIDTPYIEEGQRNLAHRRKEIRQRFMEELDRRSIQYVVISGSWKERFDMAVSVIDTKIFHNGKDLNVI